MRLFDIVNGKVIMNPTSLWIPEFKILWDRDKTEYKEQAVNEIAYVVHLCAFYSPYRSYSSKTREKKIREDSFGKDTGWQPDDRVKAAVEKFNELQETPTLRLLDAVRRSIESVVEFFENTTSEDVDKIIKNTEKIGNLVKSLDLLTRQVEKEQMESTSIRGGQGIGLFEM